MKGEKFILYSHTNTILLELFSSKLYIPLNLKKREREMENQHMTNCFPSFWVSLSIFL